MKAVFRRIARLEQRSTPRLDLALQRAAETLRERRRRRLEAEGLPFEDRTKTIPLSGPLLSYAETMRYLREQRLRRSD
jgi:hypothetical protein